MKTFIFFAGLLSFILSPLKGFGDNPSFVLPLGFSIDIFTDKVPEARSLVFDEKDNLYVSSKNGKIYRINTQGEAITIVSGLKNPFGLVSYKGDLLVSSGGSIYRIKNAASLTKVLNKKDLEVLYKDLPSDDWHGGKYMMIWKDYLLVNVGVPCNICQKKNPLFGNIVAFSLKKMPFNAQKFFAKGIRNAVGFAKDPISEEVFFTDNGQDDLGENFPFDELNHVTEPWQEHFGFPYFANERPNKGYPSPKGLKNTLPVFLFPPHSAPLGLHFYEGQTFPKEYKNNLFVALHGSWVREKEDKTGYQVWFLTLDKRRKILTGIPFLTGFREGDDVLSRPVDLKEDSKGDLYLSDDLGGKIYRISYKG